MVFGRFGAKQKKAGEILVATSRRHNVTTSQRRDAWSTEESQQATQRRKVSTSQRFTTISALASLKAMGDLISEGGKNVRIRGRKT